MSCTLEEFQELLGVEVYVYMDTLRQAARHGVPDPVRGQVWKYLLDVSKPDKSEEISQRKKMFQEYNDIPRTNPEIIKQVKADIRRYASRFERSKADKKIEELFRDPTVQAKFENVLVAYVSQNTDIAYNSGMVPLMAPFVLTLNKEPEVYFTFHALMSRIEENFTPEGLNRGVANFTLLFRTVHSELYNYFEEEELEPNEWAVSWIQFLLSRELPTGCLLRLWDTYFSAPEGIELHVYNCLAILEHCQEELLELDHAELKSFLQHLPVMDMDQIINKAYGIKDDVIAQNII